MTHFRRVMRPVAKARGFSGGGHRDVVTDAAQKRPDTGLVEGDGFGPAASMPA